MAQGRQDSLQKRERERASGKPSDRGGRTERGSLENKTGKKERERTSRLLRPGKKLRGSRGEGWVEVDRKKGRRRGGGKKKNGEWAGGGGKLMRRGGKWAMKRGGRRGDRVRAGGRRGGEEGVMGGGGAKGLV